MPQTKILIDSNCYLRLAQSIHPLLQIEFGTEKYCLYVIEEFEDEYVGQPRLQTKFPWVLRSEYVKNRRCKLNISKNQHKDIEYNLEFIQGTARSKGSNVSGVDARALAIAMVLSISCVTDDMAMRILAVDFDVQVMTTLQLLSLMVTARHCDMRKVDEVVSYWRYSKDVPKAWQEDYKKLFGKLPAN